MLTERRIPSRRPFLLLAALIVAAAVALIGVSSIMAGPSRGPIPPDAVEPGGLTDQSKVPDFIPALDRSGDEVGWVSKHLAVPVDQSLDRTVIPVFGDDLKTVVGHMIAGRGFVPLGADPNSVDEFEVTTRAESAPDEAP